MKEKSEEPNAEKLHGVPATDKEADQSHARANPRKGACSNCGGSGCDDCKWEGTASALIIGEAKDK
jgi:hypothetical protein